MAGLLQRAVGGTLAGVGAGIVSEAAQARAEALERIRAQGAAQAAQYTAAGKARQAEIEAQTAAEKAAAEAAEKQKDRDFKAGEGDKDRTSAEKRSAMAASKPGRPVPIQNEMGVVVGYQDPDVAVAEYNATKAKAQGVEIEDAIDVAADNMDGIMPEFLGGKRSATDAEKSQAYKLMTADASLPATEALRRVMTGEQGGAPAGGAAPVSTATASTAAAAAPSGDGTTSAPFEVTTEADLAWVRANGKPGTVIRYQGQLKRLK